MPDLTHISSSNPSRKSAKNNLPEADHRERGEIERRKSVKENPFALFLRLSAFVEASAEIILILIFY
jgi:hypothetical protein